MPSTLSFRRVCLVWLTRALAFLCCVFCNRSATSLKTRWDTRPFRHQDGTKAAAAVRTWQTVHSGFFPPPLLPHPRQEQVTHRRQRLVPLQAHVEPSLEMIQTQLTLLILKTAFHPPARE